MSVVEACLQGCAHSLHQSERKRERLNFYACNVEHSLFTGQREKGRERCRIWLFLFLKGMTGALGLLVI